MYEGDMISGHCTRIWNMVAQACLLCTCVHAHGRANQTMTNNVLLLNDDEYVLDNTVAMTQKRRLKCKDIWLTRLPQYQQHQVKGEADEEHDQPQRRGGIFLQQLRHRWWSEREGVWLQHIRMQSHGCGFE